MWAVWFIILVYALNNFWSLLKSDFPISYASELGLMGNVNYISAPYWQKLMISKLHVEHHEVCILNISHDGIWFLLSKTHLTLSIPANFTAELTDIKIFFCSSNSDLLQDCCYSSFVLTNLKFQTEFISFYIYYILIYYIS